MHDPELIKLREDLRAARAQLEAELLALYGR